jgi:hypothetical protein
MTTKVAAPNSRPQPAGASPPSSTASGNSSKARAEIRVPLAKASKAPVIRVDGCQ